MRTSVNILMEGLSLIIKQKGWGDAQEGSGTFSFEGESVMIIPNEEKEGGYYEISIAKDDLEWLRDKLNEYLPKV